MTALDLFSCIGSHAIGLQRAGIRTVAFCEIKHNRRLELARLFPEVPRYVDVRTMREFPKSDIVIGGPPCQRTSVAAAVHDYRDGESLWPYMLHIGLLSGATWFVVEQPPGHAAWEAEVSCSLSNAGRHVARFEYGACDVGAPYLRRRVFMVACTSVARLEVACSALGPAIERVKGEAIARRDWDPGQLAALPVASRDAREHGRERQQLIEALGDSNPPHMAEVIGRAIICAMEGSHD
jgi:site-specific DNA-cytosine methylase